MGAIRKTRAMLEAENAKLRQQILDLENGAAGPILPLRNPTNPHDQFEDLSFPNHLSFFAKASQEGFAVCDRFGIVITVDDTVCEILGRSRNEIVGHEIKEFDASLTEEEILQSLQGGDYLWTSKFETTWRRKDGQIVDVELVLFSVPGSDRLVGVCRNISQQKDAERTSAYLLNILNSATDAIIFVDQSLIVRDLNAGAIAMYGLSRSEAIGEHIFAVMESRVNVSPSHMNGFRHAFEKGHWVGDSVHPLRSGPELYVSISVSSSYDAAGELNGHVIVVRDITAQKRALRESDARYQSVVESMIEGVVVYDEKGSVLSANNSAEKIFGVTTGEIIGRSLFDIRWALAHEDGSPFSVDEYPAIIALRSGQTVRNVVMRLGKNDFRFLLVNAQPILLGGTGRPNGVVATFADITEQKHHEAQIQFQAGILRQVRHAVIVTDLEGRYTYWNNAAETLFGVKAEEVVGSDMVSFFAPEKFLVDKTNEIRQEVSSGTTWQGEVPIRALNGTSMLLESTVSLMHDLDGQPSGFIGVLEEISEKRNSELLFRQSQAHLKAIFDLSGYGLIMIAANGQILQCNKAMADLFGYSEAEMLHLTNRDLTPDEDLEGNAAMLSDIVEGRVTQKHFEKRYKRKDGTTVWCDTSITGLFDAEGVLTGFVGATQDISERLRLEAALRESQSNLLAMIENTEDLIALRDIKDRVVLCNRAFRMMYTRKTGKTLPNSDYMLVPLSTDEQSQWQELLNIVHKGETARGDYSFRMLNGEIVYLEVSLVPILEGGTMTGFGEYVRDITRSKMAEIALEEEKERYRTVADFTYNWESWTDLEGHYQYVSPSFERITGYAPADLIGNPLLVEEIAVPEDRPQISAHILYDRKSEDSGHFLFRIIARNGEMRWIEHVCQPVYRSNGEFIGRRGSYSDVTERIKAEEKIRFQATLLNLVGQAVIATDRDGKVIFWNQAATSTYGWSSADAIGNPVVRFVEYLGKISDDNFLDGDRKMKTVNGEFYAVGKSGTTFPVYATVAPILDDSSKPVGIVSVSQNITDRVDAQTFLDTQLKFQRAEAELFILLAQEPDMRISVTLALKHLALLPTRALRCFS